MRASESPGRWSFLCNECSGRDLDVGIVVLFSGDRNARVRSKACLLYPLCVCVCMRRSEYWRTTACLAIDSRFAEGVVHARPSKR